MEKARVMFMAKRVDGAERAGRKEANKQAKSGYLSHNYPRGGGQELQYVRVVMHRIVWANSSVFYVSPAW